MPKKNWRVIVSIAIAAVVLAGGFAGYLTLRTVTRENYPTYFAYTSDELESLRNLSSDKRKWIADLFEWEDLLFASASATIMSHYLPEKMDEWTAIAEEIADSCVWSGVHYRIDVDQGAVLGRRVALESLKRAG